MIITDLQPVSIVKDKGFVNFMRLLDFKYTAPSRRTLMRNHLPQLYALKHELLMQELESVDHCCLTTDMWTSRATQWYLTVTCTYINEEMELKSAVLNAIKDNDELTFLIQQVKATVTYFHKSSKASDNLVVNQNRLNLPNHKLIQQVETRWNSVYYMLNRYIEQKEAVKTTLCLLDKSDSIIPSEKTALMKDAISTLMPFEALTTEMSAEKNVTGSKVIPLSRGLQQVTTTSTSVLGVNLNNQMGNRFPL
uniref:HAT C-terminal dimerisation domain-containing protein n=1 Tax=Amphimedon queenslandica TaxID=400682 RepID=A0A1X7TK85_AMPQE